jgi:hypothetical protein
LYGSRLPAYRDKIVFTISYIQHTFDGVKIICVEESEETIGEECKNKNSKRSKYKQKNNIMRKG